MDNYAAIYLRDRIFAISEHYNPARMSSIKYEQVTLVGRTLYFIDHKNDSVIHKLDIFNMHLSYAE